MPKHIILSLHIKNCKRWMKGVRCASVYIAMTLWQLRNLGLVKLIYSRPLMQREFNPGFVSCQNPGWQFLQQSLPSSKEVRDINSEHSQRISLLYFLLVLSLLRKIFWHWIIFILNFLYKPSTAFLPLLTTTLQEQFMI